MTPLRFSILREMAKSPAHAKWAMDNPGADTPAMRLGRLAHALALGTEVGPVWEGDRRGRAWTEFKEANVGKDIVTSSEYETAAAMASALMNHGEARALLGGTRETTLHFTFAGRPCRVTPDVFTPFRLVELKSTTDARPARFSYHSLKMGYHAQLAWQQDGIEASGETRPESAFIVGVETRAPFGVSVLGVTPKALELGRRLYRTWLEEFLNCELSNVWPGYPPGTLDAPEDSFELIGVEEAEGVALDV